MKKYQNRKSLPVKNHCFLVGKVRFFSEKNQGKDHFIREKHIGKCDKTHGFSVEAAHDSYPAPCLHIDNQEYLRGVLLFEKLY